MEDSFHENKLKKRLRSTETYFGPKYAPMADESSSQYYGIPQGFINFFIRVSNSETTAREKWIQPINDPAWRSILRRSSAVCV